MPTPVTMPMLGLTMEEGTVAEWLKREGEAVSKDEPLLTVEMDKGTVEVPSPASGVLTRIVVPPGQTVPVKALIAEIGAPGEAPAAEPPAGGQGDLPASRQTPPAAEQPATADVTPGVTPSAGVTPNVTPETPNSGRVTPGVTAGVTPADYAVGGGGGWRAPAVAGVGAPAAAGAAGRRLFASPRARLRARELGVELAELTGSGPNGRIVEDDVLHAQAAVQEAGRVVATPLARRLALEHGVSIDAVRGTGPGGRITQDDVLHAAEAARAAGVPAEVPAGVPAEVPAAPAEVPAAVEPGAEGVEPLSRVRRITAERMLQSARAVARVTLTLEADFTEAARFRQQLQPEFARLGVPKLPWDALIARAAGLALTEHPAVNAQWVEGQGLRRIQAVHVGIAVALQPEGLVVPVLRDAHARSLRELTGDLLALVDKAQANRLAPHEMQGGTFTITNLGQYRVDGFTPIINPPETAILGVGRIAQKPAVVEGRVEPRTMCTLSLSFDHRVVDGAPAAACLARLAELLERPCALLGI